MSGGYKVERSTERGTARMQPRPPVAKDGASGIPAGWRPFGDEPPSSILHDRQRLRRMDDVPSVPIANKPAPGLTAEELAKVHAEQLALRVQMQVEGHIQDPVERAKWREYNRRYYERHRDEVLTRQRGYRNGQTEASG